MIPEERIRPKGYYSFKSTLETMQTVFTKDKDYELDTYTDAMEDL